MIIRATLAGAAALVVLAASVGTAVAGDFDWLEELNVEARSDPSGFQARLAARFDVADTRVRAVLEKVDDPADAYMVLRLGELSGRSARDVLAAYHHRGKRGWGRLAKELGIRPGSPAFHALKRGKGIPGYADAGPGQGPPKGKGRGKGPPHR